MKTNSLVLANTSLGAAVASSIFGLQHQVAAAIVYSGLQNKIITAIGTTDLNVNGVGLADLRLRGATGWNDLAGLNGAQVLNDLGSLPALRKLASGANISAGAPGVWATRGFPVYRYVSGSGLPLSTPWPDFGQWAQNEIAFGAFRLNAGSGNYNYGWIQLQWQDLNLDGYADKVTALDWAYESAVNTSIKAGAGATPEPSRALLALAGLGAMALRRRRKAA